ncbi:MAG: glycosyl hydrolase 115 family protein, partial [Prevotella sp.]|nr:glycosyl hydrolase 115 family protein [Prevotella sp.]
MKRLTIILTLLCACVFTMAQQEKLGVDLTKATIVYRTNDAPLVKQMANVLADDIERVSGTRPEVSGIRNEYQFAYFANKEQYIVLATVKHVPFRHHEIKGAWERYAIETKNGSLYICGSDARGLAYGVLHISEQIGVSPWYWFADVPVDKTNRRVYDYQENMVSESPSIKYRGIFINDEDWGLKTWAAQTFEKELGDIGPKTYDRVCELILRLKGNMLAPAMHSCTGAFYSHPESQKMA